MNILQYCLLKKGYTPEQLGMPASEEAGPDPPAPNSLSVIVDEHGRLSVRQRLGEPMYRGLVSSNEYAGDPQAIHRRSRKRPVTSDARIAATEILPPAGPDAQPGIEFVLGGYVNGTKRFQQRARTLEELATVMRLMAELLGGPDGDQA